MDDPETSHPFYWSAFAIVGDGAKPLIPTSAIASADIRPAGRLAAHQLLELGRGQRMGELVHRALARRLVGPAAEQPGAVAEAAAGDLVVEHLDDELGLERLPFGRALGRPAARAARRVAGEARRLDQRLELLRSRPAGPWPAIDEVKPTWLSRPSSS